MGHANLIKSTWRRRAALVPATLVLVALPTVGAAAQPGGGGPVTNPYSPAYGHPYRHGVVPTRAQQAKMNAYAASHTSSLSGSATLSYGGGIANTDGKYVGVTSGGPPKVYLVFWGSGWGAEASSGSDVTFSNDPDGGAPYIQNLFKGLGTAPSGGSQELWSATMTQYCDGSGVSYGATSCSSTSSHVLYPTGGGVLAGVWYDDSTDTTTTTTATQIAQEAVNAAGHFGNVTAALNRDVQYDILSPTGANPDGYKTGGFCAWHDYTGDRYSIANPYGYLAFTNMPYVMDAGASCGQNFVNTIAGTLDGYSIVNGHEYAETITDQFPAGGWTNLSPGKLSGEENGDECAWISSGTGAAGDVPMSTGPAVGFAMQSTWSNHDNACVLDSDQPFASSGSGGTLGQPTASFTYTCTNLACAFTDTSKDTGGTITNRNWNFGDGVGTSTAQDPSYTYGSAGTYTVTLTVTDTTGVTSTTSQTVSVTAAPSSGITLSASGYKSHGYDTVNLTWSGASGSVDVSQDGVVIARAVSGSSYTDNTGSRRGATFTYQVCSTTTSTACSNTASVTF